MTMTPRSVGLAASQTVFDGLQTPNRVHTDESRLTDASKRTRTAVKMDQYFGTVCK